MCHSKILRAVPYFAHLSNFKITTNTQISSKSQGSALAIFVGVNLYKITVLIKFDNDEKVRKTKESKTH